MTPRWPRLAALAVAGIVAANFAAAQTPKEDGKAFGALIRSKVATDAKTAPTPTTVPNFVPGVPAQSTYYTSPANLAPAAAAAAPSSVGYPSVTNSMANRATFPKVDLDATVAKGKTISADPLSYVSGFSATGTPGSCKPLPPGGPTGATYEATCNAGYTSGPPVNHSCTIPVVPTFSSQTHYDCSDAEWAFNHVDSCAIFASAGCTVTTTRPGKCLVGTLPYCIEPGEPVDELSCPVPVPGGTSLGTFTAYAGSAPDESACATWKADTTCVADPDICTDSTPVTRIVGGVAVTQPCWAFQRTYACAGPLTAADDCSTLEAKGCSLVREECITGETPCLTVDRVYKCPLPPDPADKTQYICDGDVYCLNGSCDTIDRTPNTEFKDAAVALNAASQMGKEFDPASLTVFKGARNTCSKAVFGILNCCVPRGVPLLGGCNAADKVLKEQQEKGLCSLVGSYCTSKFLGICLAKKEAHCCYLSKISRILQEQGRPQIGKPYGDPKTEQCLGFTIAEFQHLDLSVMDFSEVYAEFVDAAKLPDELATATAMQTKITDYFAAH